MLIRTIAHFKRPRKYRGQGLVEFALILPVLLLTVFVIVELARVLHAWMAIENGARFGVRYAVTGEWDDTYCPGGVCADDNEEDLARIPSAKDAARAGAVAILRNDSVTDVNLPGFFQVTVCSAKPPPEVSQYAFSPGNPNDPSASTCTRIVDGEDFEHAGDPGDTVIVSVDFTHPLITPLLTAVWPDLHLRAQRTGIVEQYRTSRVVGLPISAFTTPATPLPPADLTETAAALTETAEAQLTQTAEATAGTPTPSLTPSITPPATSTPDCSELTITKHLYKKVENGKDDKTLVIRVKNNNFSPVYLKTTTMEWEPLVNFPATTKDIKFNGVPIYAERATKQQSQTPPSSAM